MERRIEILAAVILGTYLLTAVVQWGVCFLGSSDDGLHCVGAIYSVVLAPVAVGLYLSLRWWARRRRDGVTERSST